MGGDKSAVMKPEIRGLRQILDTKGRFERLCCLVVAMVKSPLAKDGLHLCL